MAKKRKKVEPCTECGGPRRGRKAHEPGCSLAKGSTQLSGGNLTGVPAATLRKMDVDQLLDLRERVNKAIQDRAPELKERIADLQKTLKVIQGK